MDDPDDDVQERLEELRERGFMVSERPHHDGFLVGWESGGLVVGLRLRGDMVDVLDPAADDVIPVPLTRLVHWVLDRFGKGSSPPGPS
jgi:hypothetical protein